ncbi:MAG: hypothetical protein ABI615_10930, partial [Chthoniobacterales bacterium]
IPTTFPWPARAVWRWVAAVLIAGLLPAQTLYAAKAADRVSSSSGQFIVFSADKKRGSAVAKKAEQIKEDLLRIFNLQDRWKHIILIQLIEIEIYHKSSAPFLLTMHDAVDNTLRIQLDVAAAGSVDTATLVREILRSLLLEMMYRKQSNIATQTYHFPPNWLVEALLAMMKSQDPQLDDPIADLSAKASALKVEAPVFGQLIKNGETPKLDELIAQKPGRMDTTTRILYRAQAMALLRAWMETPHGKEEVLNYLVQCSQAEPNKALFLSCFTATGGSEAKLQRLWTLALARYSATDRLDSFSVEETEKSLAKILDVKNPVDSKNSKEKPVKENKLIALARQKNSKIIFQQMQADLLRLNIRAHPLYRPIVQQYIAIAEHLAKGKVAKMGKPLAELEATRKLVQERMGKVSDYLNWYEASRMNTQSGEFDEILKNAARYDLEKSKRNDPISRYLDGVEERGW